MPPASACWTRVFWTMVCKWPANGLQKFSFERLFMTRSLAKNLGVLLPGLGLCLVLMIGCASGPADSGPPTTGSGGQAGQSPAATGGATGAGGAATGGGGTGAAGGRIGTGG